MRGSRYAVSVMSAALLAVGLAWACGSGASSSSTSPSTTTPNTTPTVSSISVSGSSPTVDSTAQFSATATFSNSTTQSVTNSATWASSNTSVATVTTTGLVTGVTSGTVDITATYQNVTGTSQVTIVRQTFTVTGTVRDGTSNGVLPNITVSALDSADVAHLTVTSASGSYSIAGVASGVVAITASATGYQTTTQSVTVASDTQVNITLPRFSSGGGNNGGTLSCNGVNVPALVACPNNGGTQTPTARCNDGTYSCSQNRSGTCSSHGGVACWVCPGPLCGG